MVSSITCFSPNNVGNKFAVGADSGITIWSAVGNSKLASFKETNTESPTTTIGTWKAVKELGPPQRYADNVREPVEVVGMHWLETKTDRLIVVYKAHGVQCICFILMKALYGCLRYCFRLWDVSSGNVVSNILTTSAAMYMPPTRLILTDPDITLL